ncbi:MAG TPA: class A beta-lactamase [Blastocatellia bacterium]|nr:class A beta-lactamase [Blastocatellia bacterium]
MRKTVRTTQRTIISLLLALTLSATAAAQTSATTASQPANDPALQRLEREIARLSTVSGGVVGVTAIHLETGRRVSLNPTERFPMASTFKVPIAVQLLTRIDKAEVKLDQMIEIKQSDLHPGSGTLSDLFNKGGLALSVRNLMELMLLISDNSATDVMLRTAGGAEAVTARMRALGIEGINVNRSTAQLIADWVGVTNLPPEDRWNPVVFSLAFSAVKPEDQKAAAKKFDADPRDTSTPDGMAALLERIYRKDLLKPESAELLLDIMRRCRTGEARLRGLLPQGTEIAHKTGTIGGSTNDVGIITLPDNAGHVAIAAFVKLSEKEVSARERAIAEIARAVHDFFLFQPRPSS